jgi:hypothetical protein
VSYSTNRSDEWLWERGLITAEEYVAAHDVPPPGSGLEPGDINWTAVARHRELLDADREFAAAGQQPACPSVDPDHPGLVCAGVLDHEGDHLAQGYHWPGRQWDNGEPETTGEHAAHAEYDPDCRACAAELCPGCGLGDCGCPEGTEGTEDAFQAAMWERDATERAGWPYRDPASGFQPEYGPQS